MNKAFEQIKRLALVLGVMFLVAVITFSQANAALTDFYITNATQDQSTENGSSVNIVGYFSSDDDGLFSVSATIDGVTKTFTQTIPNGTTAQQSGWVLSWGQYDVTGGAYGGPDIPVMVTGDIDNQNSQTLPYTGWLNIGVEPITEESIARLSLIGQLLDVRFAGTVYLPKGTNAGDPQVTDYTYVSTLSPDHQIWSKTLGDGLTYPFLIQFFEKNSDRGSIGQIRQN